MPINFPDSPSTGDTHTVGDKTWTYDGTAWNVVQNNIADHGNLGGLGDDDHTQYLLADGTRTATELTVSGDLTVDTDTLYVDSTNSRVGIGTTTPSADLHIADTSTTLHLQDTGGTVGGSMSSMVQFTDSTGAVQAQVGLGTSTGYFLVDNNDGPMRVGTASADSLYLRTNNANQLTIDSTGNVGIGTTSPSAQLTVQAGSTGTNDGTVEFHKWLGSASSPTETEDWPTPVLALRSYDNFNTMNMLSFGYPQDAVYQTGGNVWSMRLSGVSGATSSSSSTNLQVVGPGTLDINSPVDILGAISTLGSTMLGVRQVLASHKTGYSVTGTTEIDTGLSVTITPKSTSSKILIFWTHGYYLTGNCNLNSRLKRGTTQLQLNYAGDWGSAGNGTANNYYLDTPNTTSAVTYKTTMQSNNTTAVYVSNSSQSSYLLVVEIL